MMPSWRVVTLALLGALGAAPASTQTIRALPLRVTTLVAEPVSGRLYAALPGDAGAGVNSVVAIDPVAGSIGPPLFVGSEPRLLVPSDDGQFLYVGLGGASAIRRVDLAAAAAGPLFPLRLSGAFDEPGQARAIVAVPGAPSTVVVVLGAFFNSAPGEVVAYDDGVPRPVRLHEPVDGIVALDGATLVANTSQELLRLRLDASGISVTARQRITLGAPRVQAVAGGLVFTEGGWVFDATTLQLVRRLQSPSSYTEQQQAVPALGRSYRLSRGRLITHDLETFDIRETQALQPAHGVPQSLVPLGGGVAYHTALPAVVLVGDFGARPQAAPPSAVSMRIDLAGCVDCRVGMPFRAEITFGNVTSAPMTVEIKAGIRTPGGAVLPTVFGGPHSLLVVTPGVRTDVILAGVVPPNTGGEWRIDVTLVDPASGRTLATSSRAFRVLSSF